MATKGKLLDKRGQDQDKLTKNRRCEQRFDNSQNTPTCKHMMLTCKGAVVFVCDGVRKKKTGHGGRGEGVCVKYLLILPSNWTFEVGNPPSGRL